MEELIDEVELTSLFNKLSDGSKNINSENAIEIIYKLGYVPSKEDIEEFVNVTNGSCTLSNIKKFCIKLKSSRYSTESLIDLFYFYDTQKTGKISKNKFKILFTTIGSKLSNKEIDIITRELCNDGELIDYKEFLNK
ncbi:myosin light chain, putative [Plasmodium relictum]|uniref:Myosin light chain, putative n=1 Tax=Plasmodium relictum TaxID=85471 RepID=A0A1J1H7H3_PLARL|nr:myosin light chain, putative [Plasmodium relictum]CRH00866.1 myosin light chain, putative [Plasmodium relictum]